MRRTAASVTVFAWVALAPPASATTFTVNIIGDAPADACDASCTLRDAITAANAAGGDDDIAFNIPGTGPHQISPSSALPPITEVVGIDGTTEPDYTVNEVGVEIDGAVAGADANGLFVNNVAGVDIRGLAITNFDGAGILTSLGSSDTTITANFIGTGTDGTSTGSGNEGNGIDLGGDENTVGGTAAADRNVIGGNGTTSSGTHGVYVHGENNTIIGNHIGVDRQGLSGIPNVTNGIQLDGANNDIGGTAAGARNVISGNDTFGIGLNGADGNEIYGNYIGVGSDGATPIPQPAGVSPQNGSVGNVIGGIDPGEGNVISGNSGVGVFLAGPATNTNSIQGNLIGTDATGTLAVGNGTTGVHIDEGDSNSVGANTIANNGSNGVTINGGLSNYVSVNRIRNNGGLGISLNSNSTQEPNDAGDADTGPNGLQNYPVIRSIVINGGTATVTGTLNSTPSSSFFIEGFKSTSCDPSGFGEGGQFIGQDTVVNTDAAGNATFQFTASGITGADVLTAVAIGTALTAGSSEFSPCGAQPLPPPAGGSAAAPGPSIQTLPPPTARRTVNVAVVNGEVKIKQPGGRYRTLTDPAQIRMGSLIDTTNGRIRLTTAAGGGKTQIAEFYDGLFKVTQTKGKKPITDLTLAGKLAGCSSKKASAAAKRRRGRRLWGKGKGRFRTRGKRSSALVRGTIWLVEDRCNGTTVTTVRAGRVEVRDFKRKRTKIVRAGRKYVAR